MAGWNAEDYHRSSSEQQRWAREMIARLRLSGGESVLDIGCGDGKVTAEIARQLPGGFALGIDNSEEMIRFARRSFPPESCPNLAFERADASALAYDRRFDPVVSFACLHWMKDHRPVLAGIARSLKPDGRFLLQFGGKGNAAQMVEVVHRAIAAPEWRSFFEGMAFPWGFYSPEEYAPWLREAGLTAERMALMPKDMAHSGPEGLAAWLRTTWHPYTGRIPPERQQAFLEEIARRYQERYPPDENGLIHLPMMRLEVEGRKSG